MSRQVKIWQQPLPHARCASVWSEAGVSSRRGMTIIEMLVAVLIIFLLMALLIGAVRLATRNTQEVAHRSAVTALRQGVSMFQQEFGFLPPLVLDNGEPPGFGGDPLNGGRIRIATVSGHGEFLRTAPPPDEPDRRFSIYSLPYYLIGAFDASMDGVDGPGFRTPNREGQFERRGRIYEPFFAVGSGSTTLYAADADQGRFELRDSNGNPVRYYRWEPHPNPPANATLRQRTGIPVMVVRWMPGDPWDRLNGDEDEPGPSILNARYAIVGAGPSGIFGDEHVLYAAGDPRHMEPLAMAQRLRLSVDASGTGWENVVQAEAMRDNVVEVGR